MTKRVMTDALELAKMLGVAPATVYRNMAHGRLPYVEFGGRKLIRIADVEELFGIKVELDDDEEGKQGRG